MKVTLYTKIKAFALLFIILISNIGLPFITHQCNEKDKTDISIFSVEKNHCCSTPCCSIKENTYSLGLKEIPCCTYETNIFSSNSHLVSKYEAKKFQILSSFVFLPVLYKQTLKETRSQHFNSNYRSLYGLEYRIDMQSFLC